MSTKLRQKHARDWRPVIVLYDKAKKVLERLEDPLMEDGDI
jgi:hypothetical protein